MLEISKTRNRQSRFRPSVNYMSEKYSRAMSMEKQVNASNWSNSEKLPKDLGNPKMLEIAKSCNVGGRFKPRAN